MRFIIQIFQMRLNFLDRTFRVLAVIIGAVKAMRCLKYLKSFAKSFNESKQNLIHSLQLNLYAHTHTAKRERKLFSFWLDMEFRVGWLECGRMKCVYKK